MGWRVTLSDQADLDLEHVVAFLAKDSPTAALRLGMDLVAKIFSLTELPRRGLPVRGRPGYRRVLQRPYYLIFYRVDEPRQWVEILRVWDARQDPERFSLP